jgi:DnaJ family protein A protein 5
VSLPPFGDGDTPYEEVKEFYNFWKSFVSRREFGWRDKWNLAEAPNRQTRRLMEKEVWVV